MRRVSVIGLLTLACLVAIASPAGADWKQQPVPAPSGAVTGNMNGVWCPTTTTCTAVGSYSGSSGTQPLAEVSTNGASWAIQSVPVPSGATTAELNAVNCQPNGQCTAVGDYTDGAGQHPLIETRAGSTWTIQSAPQPAGTAAAQLVGVSCTSTSSCDAVGSSTSGSATAALLETLSAGTWSIASLPLPSGTTTSSLGGVSCPTAGFCVVAGTASPGSGQNALAETWNGTSWTIQTIPSPPGATATSLDAVSCSSPTACFVVGAHQADRFNGTSWKSLYVPTPGPHTGLTDLTGVACPVATRCYSAGFYYVDGVETAITEIWNGAKWAADGPAITASNDSSGMSAIACSDDTLCASVGWYHDPTNGNQLLIDSFELRWQQQTVTAPSGAIASNMTAVSCTSPTACMAVDQFEGSGSTFGTSAQQWNGGSWTDIATPNSANSVLSGISCAKTMCMAVGDVNNAGNIVPVAEQWNGSSWTVESVPAPAAAASSYLLADSCVSTTSCVAVGEYRDSSGNQYTLADSWNGTTWTLDPTPNLTGSVINSINWVSCVSSTDCVAVGASSPGTYQALIFNWDGTTWTMQNAPAIPGGSDSSLSGIDCVSASWCMAVGSYFDGTATVPLSYTWDGTSWIAYVGAYPNGVKASGFSGVSCNAPGKCIAVGYADYKTGLTPLGDRFETTLWTTHTASVPGSEPAVMTSVSCLGDNFCEGVGYDTPSNNFGNNSDFAQQWS